MQENFSKDEDLDLLAFRYIAGELTPAESEPFEQRLADDQAAREAVARAVDLAQAVASAPADTVPLPTTHHSPLTTHTAAAHRRLRPVRWIAAAAAVVLGLLGIQFFKGPSDQTTLAKVWASLRLGQDVQDVVETPNLDLIAESEESAIDDEDDLTVPGWMMEAVAGSDPDKWEDS
jgi:hypothetical protein